MFRKVQLKFFGIIIGILLAIFIALLFAINIIMDMVMERQSQYVLQQVASGVEYNIETAEFTLTDPNIYYRGDEHGKNDPPPPSEPIFTTAATSVTTVTSTVFTSTTTVETTAETTAEEHHEPEPTQPEHHEPEPPHVEPTEPPQPPTEPASTEPWTVPQDWGWWNPWWGQPWWGQNPQYPQDGGQGGDPNGGHNDHGGDPNQNPVNPWWNPNNIQPQAYYDDKPVLDGYTIETDDVPPPKPRNDYEPEKYTDQVPKSLGTIDFFIIMADTDGQFLAKLNNDDMDEEIAQKYATMIFNDKKSRGMADNFQYHREPKSNGMLMVLTDRTAEIDMMKKLKRTTFLVGVISIIVLSVAAYFLSGLIVRPLKETFDKQKQFISDASHELKTPLTVISTNADVLSGEIGDNKWLTYIQDQAARMNVLVNDLLSLTRLENKSSDFKLTYFSLSHAITNTALPFECQAFEAGKNFVLNIDDGINIIASEHHIRQMAGIFIDNALKYSKENGTVRVSLTKEDGKTVFSVFNTGAGVKEEEKYRIFERFYRSDESRNRATGGYGLGLAIAKSIIDKHKFKLIVDNHEGVSICFMVIM